MREILRNILDVLRIGRGKATPPAPVVEDGSGMRVACNDCSWKGTIGQSLRRDTANDSCPQCGNTVLVYEL